MLLLILRSPAVEQAARIKMKRLAILLIFATAAAAAPNISGVWSGAFRAVGGDSDVPQLFILKQEGAELTGTGGTRFQ
jgi:hypothetical protein